MRVVQRVGGYGSVQVSSPAVLRVRDASGAVTIGWTHVEHSLAVPTGGPYLIEGQAADGTVLTVETDLLVGDLWVLGGQSNMQGGAVLRDLEEPGPLVRLFGMDRAWQLPVEPLHRLWHSPDPVHHASWEPEQRALIDDLIAATLNSEDPHVGAGLGIAFANEYVATTGVPVGLVPAAYGGSGLNDWSPAHPAGLFSAMVSMARAAGPRVAGLLWHQGESETGSDETVCDYVASTRAVFDAFRKDLDQPELPVLLAQIGGFPIVRDAASARRWTGVRLVQLDPEPLAAQGVVATIDLTTCDPIHLDALSQRRLGRRFARLATGQAQTISVADVTRSGRLVDWPEVMEHLTVHIRLSGLTGGLRSDARLSGFSVRAPAGALVPCVWRVNAADDTVVVQLAGPPVEGAALYYGWGTGSDTYCNLVDEADNAVPCFGPVPL